MSVLRENKQCPDIRPIQDIRPPPNP